MGFLTPGKPTRKRTKEHRANIERVKRARLLSTPPPQTRPSTPPKPESITPEDEAVKDELGSILLRLPVELLHKVFTLSGLNALPFVCKSLLTDLKPSLSLRVEMLRNYIHDLNSGVSELGDEYETRYALDVSVLKYRFVDDEALGHINFNTVLTLETINAEKKNRMVLYYDKLNKRLLDMLRRSESSEHDINLEIQRITRERRLHNLDEVELSELPLLKAHDYPERFYKGPFDEKRLLLIEELGKRSMEFSDVGKVIKSAILSGHDELTIKRLLQCSEKKIIADSQPIIAAFEKNDMNLATWILENCEDDSSLVNDDDLWVYLSTQQNTQHLHFIQQRGGVPNHEILGSLGVRSD